MKFIENLCYAEREGGALCLDLYLPDAEKFDLFVYFHGGGLEKGSKDGQSTKIFAPWLAERGVAVASCDYRMYPNAEYPDFIRDAAEAVAWLSRNINSYGACERIFVGGSSAGAYLSMMLCFDGRWYCECGDLPVAVCGYFHDAGQPTCHFKVLSKKGIDPRRVMIDDSAPLYHIGERDDYPPMAFIVADSDMQNRYEQTQLTMSTLRHFGYNEDKLFYRLMHGTHCSYVKLLDENGDSVFGNMIAEWIKGI